jgi:hypothetical protein
MTDSLVSVLISATVFELAELAIGWRQAVVHAMLYRLEGAHVGKHGFQIIVGKAAEFSEGEIHEILRQAGFRSLVPNEKTA